VPRTPARSPSRPDPSALPDPARLDWRRGPPDAADPRGEPGWAASLPEAAAADRRLIQAQLGRDVRGSVAVAARCRYGLPAVVRTAPRLPDGTPFPTLYWLACPAARVAVGRLEAAGWNALLSGRLAAEPELATAHAQAHAGYLAQRDRIERLQAKQRALQAENERLERERARLRDPAYVQQLAKRDFHLVEPGEEAWVMRGTPPAAAAPAAAPATPAPKQPWYKRAWQRFAGWLR